MTSPTQHPIRDIELLAIHRGDAQHRTRLACRYRETAMSPYYSYIGYDDLAVRTGGTADRCCSRLWHEAG